ncbi:hypothetical protein KJ693_02385 [bacterium]|nr:hypothetical protein [bacterium]MBU1614138.1 hypothetical protein [bacterium]
MKKALVLSLLLPVIFGCAHLQEKPVLPGHIKSLVVPIFVNRSTRFGLEEEVANQIINEFILDGRLLIAPEREANSKIEGEIISYHKEPLSYNEQGYTLEYKIWIQTGLKFIDLQKQKMLWEDEEEGAATYVPENIATQGLSTETEEEALDRAILDLAQKVVSRTIEGW